MRDFNLEIEEGEFVVLVGPSGCGKRRRSGCGGLEDITSGRLIIDGKKDVRRCAQDRTSPLFSELRSTNMTVCQKYGFSLVCAGKTPICHRKCRGPEILD